VSVLFAGVDPSVPGGVSLPPDPAALIDLLLTIPPGTLICAALAARPVTADLRRILRAGVRPDVRMVDLAVPPTVVPVVASLPVRLV
jgi:hypothetical protein